MKIQISYILPQKPNIFNRIDQLAPQARMTQFLRGEYFMYLSLCNPKKALPRLKHKFSNQLAWIEPINIIL